GRRSSRAWCPAGACEVQYSWTRDSITDKSVVRSNDGKPVGAGLAGETVEVTPRCFLRRQGRLLQQQRRPLQRQGQRLHRYCTPVSALFDWHELALFDAGVFGARADDAVVGTLF